VFSGRTSPTGAPRNSLSLLLDEKRRAGAAILDLTVSNPTVVGLPYPSDLLAPLADPRGLVYEPSPRGLAVAREALAAELGVAAGDLLLCASTSEAYAFLFELLCDAGDEVLVPGPGYPLFTDLAAHECVATRAYPLVYAGEWHIALEEVRPAARTRAIVVVSPGNPTGAAVRPAELAALAAHGVPLIIDEVFAERPEHAAPGLVFRLGGLSKSLGLPQLKLAWIHVAGPHKDEALERLESIADAALSVATPVMLALPELLRRAAPVRDAIRARVRHNRAALAARLAGTAISLLHADGGWSAILRLPATRSDEEIALGLLRDHDLLVHPGFFFDLAGTHLVVSLLVPPGDLARGAEIILTA
jgi:aspartate/methionine/tyrosine aminotransferase